MSKNLMWGYLAHLGYNMWADMDAANIFEGTGSHALATDYLQFERETWNKVSDKLAKGGCNTIILDIGEGMIYESHPELAIKGSWTKKEVADELSRLRSLGFDVHSPKEEAICGAISSQETRQAIFQGNINAINDCDIVFAITDGKDMGTIWEAGYAYGLNDGLANAADAYGFNFEPIKIVYYCETLGDGLFNLMLAQSGDIIITKFEDVDKLPELLRKGEKLAYAGRIE